MSLFLTILKIIGIVLLVILALLLIVLLLVLFVPIRYYVNADIEETNLETEVEKLKERIHAKAGFSFLLHLVRGYIEYPEDMEFTVKVLFFKVFPKKNKEDSTGKNNSKQELPYEMEEGFEDKESEGSDSEQEADNASDASESDVDESKDEIQNEVQEESQNVDINDGVNCSENEDSKSENEIDEDDFEDEEDDEKSGFIDVLRKIKDIVVAIIKAPQNVYQKIKCTISSIYAKIDMIKKTLENDIFKRAFKVSKKQILRVLKMVIPKKCSINLHIGMSDPTVTADILAAYGVLYPILAGKVFVTPDFEKPVLSGTVRIKGKIRLVTIVWAAAVFYFNKDIRKTLRRFKKIFNS
ncbi:hypothetical protein [Butyrivibrio sp. WCD3002]|uniref:hypothetical protein n=1 Tax=Butyrivibrio sp. WCD3002 TaxID=1280676 RepID=UPI000413E108|nr:hypothetical protein [Butyrivibrio sp. WCD3002]